MELNSQSHEGLSASSAAFAALLQHGHVAEVSRPIGIYTATHLAPHEGEREKRHALLKEQDHLLKMGRAGQFWNRKRIAFLEEAVDDFAMIQVGPTEVFKNLVPDAAARHNLDTWLAGSAYSVVGPFMGLISSVSYTAIANSDIMANLATTNGWREAGAANAPLYSGGRKTMVFSAAATRTKSLSSNLTFSFVTTGGTVKGCFMVLSTGAVATNDNTSGLLGSAGLFSADKIVAPSDSLSVGYTITV